MNLLVVMVLVIFSTFCQGLPLGELKAMEEVMKRKMSTWHSNTASPNQNTQNPPKSWEPLKHILKASLKCQGSPRAGATIQIFKGNTSLYSTSMGYADISKDIPLAKDSLLAIGSVSKSFTSTILASLASQGKFDFNADVRTYLPELQFPPSMGFSSQPVTAVDLLAHRLGLGDAGSSMWASNAGDLQRSAMGLQFLSPGAALRTRVDYCNIAVATAGWVAMRIGNLTWEELVQREVFLKLGMNYSVASWKGAFSSGRYTKIYGVVNGELVEYAPEAQQPVDNVAPAGSIFSTIQDLTKYIQFHLSGGINEHGEQVIPRPFLDITHSPREVYHSSPFEQTFAPFSLALTSSAMGWFNGHFNGRSILWHNGGLPGGTSLAVFLPFEDLGMVYLSNTDNSNLDYLAVMVAALEIALQGSTNITPGNVCTFPCPWKPECFRPLREEVEKRKEDWNASSLYSSLGDYVGVYAHPAFGELIVKRSSQPSGGLVITYGSLKCLTASQDRDLFVGLCYTVVALEPMQSKFSFGRGLKNLVERITIPLFDPEPLTFTNSNYSPQSWTYPRLLPIEH